MISDHVRMEEACEIMEISDSSTSNPRDMDQLTKTKSDSSYINMPPCTANLYIVAPRLIDGPSGTILFMRINLFMPVFACTKIARK